MKKILKFLLATIIFAVSGKALYGQEKSNFNIKISGGGAYSFFLNRYQENPFNEPNTFEFYRKNLIGYSLAVDIGRVWRENNKLSIRYNFQEFRRVVDWQSERVPIVLDNYRIFHRNNVWNISYARNFLQGKKSHFWFGGGIYYIRPVQQEIEITNSYAIFVTRDNKKYRLHEIGISVEMDYEIKLKENIYTGLRVQYAHGLSDGVAHFISLTSYLNLEF